MPCKRWPSSAAIAAALILTFQALLGGAWMGAQAAAGPHDVFGNVLCTSDAGGAAHRSSHEGGYDCDCCLSGCDHLAKPASALAGQIIQSNSKVGSG